MPHLDITNDDLRLIRRALVSAASAEWLNRDDERRSEECRRLDDLLDRLPEPLDELILGDTVRRVLGMPTSAAEKEAIREARYRVENGGL